MAVPEAVWCVMCGAVPDVALTVERNGVLAHYGACWAHVGAVAARARRDMATPRLGPLSGAVGHADAIEATEAQPDAQRAAGGP